MHSDPFASRRTAGGFVSLMQADAQEYFRFPDVNDALSRGQKTVLPFSVLRTYPNSIPHDDLDTFRYGSNFVINLKPVPRKLRQRSVAVCQAIFAGFLTVEPRFGNYHLKRYSRVQAAIPIVRIIRWILERYASDQERLVAQYLKSLCNWLRYLACPSELVLSTPPPRMPTGPFTGSDGRLDLSLLFCGELASCRTSTRAMLRLSRMGRALPPGGSDVFDETVAKHRKIVCEETADPPPTSLLDAYRSYAYKLRPTRFKLPVPRVSFPAASGMDGLMNTHVPRSAGGAEYVILGALGCSSRGSGYYQAASLNANLPSLAVTTFGPYLSVLSDLIQPEVIRRLDSPASRVARMIAIPDRGGFKCRGITVSDAVIQQHCTPLRRVLYQRVLSHMECDKVIKGDYEHASLNPCEINNLFRRRSPLVILSADLTAATDYFPISFQEAFNISFFPNNMKSDPQVRSWFWLSRPHKISYPSIKGEPAGGVTMSQQRGTLMGTVPSWFHLNVLNSFLIRLSYCFINNYAADRKGHFWNSLFSPSAFTDVDRELLLREVLRYSSSRPSLTCIPGLVRICGDDLQATLPIGAALVYEILVACYGGKLSEGKHYVFLYPEVPLSGPHVPFSVFAETFCSYKEKGRSDIAAPSLRSVTSGASSDWRDVGTKLIDLERTCSSPIEKRALLSLAYLNNSKTISNIRSSRPGAPALPFFLPRTYGGMGCPDIHGDVFRGKVINPQQLRLITNLRSLRTDPVRFIFEVLKIRYSWYLGAACRVGPWIDRIDKDLFSTVVFDISRDSEGRLDVCRDRLLGLRGDKSDVLLSSAIVNLAAKLSSVASVDEYTSSTKRWEELCPTGRQMTIYQAKVNFRRQRQKLNDSVAKGGITVPYIVEGVRHVARSNAGLDNIPSWVWRRWETEDKVILEGLYISRSGLMGLLSEVFPEELIKTDLDPIFESSDSGVGDYAPFAIKGS